jgi:type IV secretion system protein VirB9
MTRARAGCAGRGACSAALAACVCVTALHAPTAAGAAEDSRIRTSAYVADEVYRLQGYVGYQIDLEFEAAESFVGLGAGDLEGLTFAAQANHLFLKPKAAGIETNLTVLTTRRTYHFEYQVSGRRPDPALMDVIYVLRFAYPVPAATPAATQAVERRLTQASGERWHNLNYLYRGSPALKPQSAWDDGVQTRLRFGPRQEQPAIFLRNDDGSESLLNFSDDAGEVILQRVAHQLVLRRGRLVGCIVNQAFTGAGETLPSGTVSPAVERVTRDAVP